MENKMEYYLGLDMGTSSVGWAVTDKNYNLLRAKGKDLWGTRLFKEASTSAKRRVARISKRRRTREMARIGLLKEIFAEEIHKKDPAFYLRLSESKYKLEDKRTHCKNGVFSDNGFDDKAYYRAYPTVFHLRKTLIESRDEQDVRLVFLALLSMFKTRGHFLNANLEVEENSNLLALFEALFDTLEVTQDVNFERLSDTHEIEAIMRNKEFSRTQVVEAFSKLLHITRKDKIHYEIVKAMCGLKFTFSTIFGEDCFGETQLKASVSFRDSNYDEKISEFLGQMDEMFFEIIELLKQIHDQLLLINVKKGHEYISYAKVESYEKHKEDLQLLKKIVKKYCVEKYDEFFRNEIEGNYSAYIGSSNAKGKFRRGLKNLKIEDFYSSIKKLLKNCPADDDEVQYVLGEIENENFLPKQRTTENGVIPNQLHLIEMKAILTNAETYLPFLKMKDETGLSLSEKIISLFEFQIPYYIGPLNDKHKNKGGNAWVVRNNYERVYPWNFESVIDVQKTSELFIERLLRNCTYIRNHKVLPKNSLLYEKYMVLDELNNLRIRGEKPSIKLKQEIYETLFTSGKKVTRKKLIEFLCSRGIIKKEESSVISGIDEDFKQTLSSYGKFFSIFGESLKHEETVKMVEQIIFWGTIHGQDKVFYKENIRKRYGNQLDEAQLKRIFGFKFKDWGRLSRNFLEMQGCHKETGEVLPLIQMLWHQNDNLMTLLSDRYTYKESLMQENGEIIKTLSEFEYSDLDGLYLSAPVKRMVWQTTLVIRELEQTIGAAPKRVFVEMARGEGEKGKRTSSRKNRLMALYKMCKEDSKKFLGELENLAESDLRIKKLYLYYMQKGRCMYSGEPIALGDLSNNNLYDLDHIYPRHYVKDDSLENNLVLVKKQLNSQRGDTYPISENIYKRQHEFWKSLLSKDGKDGFITREKYKRLVCRESLTDEQLEGFINRQLVETRQGTKAITQILSSAMPNSEIIFVKANNVSDFRHKFDYLKSRIVNDFHHAQDAYLCIAVGNTYYVKFTKNPAQFIKQYKSNQAENEYHMSRLFEYEVKRGNEVAWTLNNEKGNSSISIINKAMSKNTILITRMVHEGSGELFNATLYSAKKAKKESYVPFKSSDARLRDVESYGGYSSVSTAYFFLVEHEEKGKRIRTIETLPLMLKESIGDDRENLTNYCINELQLKEPDVRLNKIKLMSLVKRDGYYIYLSGKTGGQISIWNGVSLVLKANWIQYIKKIEKVCNAQVEEAVITKEINIKLYDELVYKHENTIFSKRINPIISILKKGRSQFLELDEKTQCSILYEILKISQLGPAVGNLVEIGGSKNSGTLKINSKISNCVEFKLVNQSITGLYQSEIDLLTI